jgi:vacuolar-type H+-ATPase subunit E/Vma4
MESSAQRIIDRILQDAREEAKSIIDEAQKSVETLLEQRRESASKSAEDDVRPLKKKTESQVEIVTGRVIMDTKREASWRVLTEKERLVFSVFNEVKSRLQELQKSEKYVPVLEKMIIESGSVLGGGKLEVLLSEEDSSLLKLDELAKRITEKTGVKTEFTLSKQKISTVGTIVRTIDGRIVVNNTIDAILKRRKKELSFKIAKILFED